MFVGANGKWRLCAWKNQWFFFYFYFLRLFYIQEWVSKFFLFCFFTHNANQCKCCCRSLTLILHARIGSTLQPVLLYSFLLLSSLQSDFAVWRWGIWSWTSLRIIRLVWSLGYSCCVYTVVAAGFIFAPREREQSRQQWSLVGEFSKQQPLWAPTFIQVLIVRRIQ